MNKPLVSVVMITYGHEKYIQQAIESILIQQCNFEIELIISNDCSPDNSDAVINDIIRNHPKSNLIQYHNHVKNIGMMNNFVFALQQAKGTYIAICEGDDYWIDSLKLQKQVDYLEENADCSLCFHPSIHLNDANHEHYFIYKPVTIPIDHKFVMKDAVLGGGSFITTNSMFFHQQYITILPDWFLKAPIGDLPLMLLLATKGKIGYINEVMSTYRLMSNNSWSATLQDAKKKKKHFYAVLKMWSDFDKWTNYKFHGIILRKKALNYYSYWKQILYIKKQLIFNKK
jgi:glycosyltransferase involved in cell wall biosynthesis